MKILGAVLRNIDQTFRQGSDPVTAFHGSKRAADDGDPLQAKRFKLSLSSHQPDAPVFDSPLVASPMVGRNLKAARADDADVPKWMWNDRIWALFGGRIDRQVFDAALELLDVATGGTAFALELDSLVGGLDAIYRATCSTWWEWDKGSRLFFWRWLAEYVEIARDGLRPWFKKFPARWVRPQRVPSDAIKLAQMRAKVKKVMDRGYIAPGRVLSLMNVFEVPKGDSDIRLVYDGTKSGLNDVLYAPWFPLPNVESLLRCVDGNTWCGDNDIGEQFHNFCLHPSLQPYCGIDLTRLFPDLVKRGESIYWECWTRAPMGIKTSPYQAAQGMIWWEETVRGDRRSESNPLRWERIVLNLPGMRDYDPSMPWVYKARKDGSLAADFRAYVDDLRATGRTREDCWQVTRAIGSKASAAGIQDASRKRREVSQSPGAWAGAVLETNGQKVGVKISQERWDKTKRILDWIKECIKTDSTKIPFKTLESHRGFLVYISRTYPATVPYLKGIHLTLDEWRDGRDDDGWAIPGWTREAPDEEDVVIPTGAPATVKAVKRLRADINALCWLFDGTTPVLRMVRPEASAVGIYGFGDASGYGFGSTLLRDGKVLYRMGQWTKALSDESSNFREFSNLILAVEEHGKDGQLDNCELFLFTDNTTAEACFYKGTSKSKKIFGLVLRLRYLQMKSGLHLHVIHVSGKRMMAQGTDGLSRGDMLTGVFGGRTMLDFVPLNLSAFERSPSLLSWMLEWYPPGRQLLQLNPEDWYDGVLNTRMDHCLWFPAPASAEAAVEQLCLARLKRPNTTHIIIIPWLLTSRWRKLLSKTADVVLTLPLGVAHWELSQHEPLILALCLPMIRLNPWRLKGTPIVERLEGQRGHWTACQGAWCDHCYRDEGEVKFPVAQPEDEEGFPLVDDGDEDRFMFGRKGDHLMSPFQCDLCHFRNIQKRNPSSSGKDTRLMIFIRRANLDALWSREPSTIYGNLSEARRMASMAATFGIGSLPMLDGPLPVKDTFGMAPAILMLARSLDVGRNRDTVQFNTCRKTRSVWSNCAHANLGADDEAVMGSNGTQMHTSRSTTNTLWYGKFYEGCHRRMGDQPKPDQAISIAQLLSVLEILNDKYLAAERKSLTSEQLQLALTGLYVASGFLGGLRGEEVLLIELSSVRKHFNDGLAFKPSHVLLPLLGRFKGETGERCFLLAVVPQSASGIDVEIWMARMIECHETSGKRAGWVFPSTNGRGKARIADYDPLFHEALRAVQDRRPNLIKPGVDVENDFSLRRSLRRGSTTQALNVNVPVANVEYNNGWRKHQRAGAKAPSLSMIQHYTDVKLALPFILRYSRDL